MLLARHAHWIAVSATFLVMCGAGSAAAPGTATHSEMVVSDQNRKYWSFLPLRNPTLPAVKNSSSINTPVDRFTVSALEEKQLGLSPQAGARKLARRIYFDLIGLPPTPEQVDAF